MVPRATLSSFDGEGVFVFDLMLEAQPEEKMTQRKFLLSESDLPTHWYNIAADLKSPPPPPLHPATHEPIGPEMLAPLFPMELIMQEVSTERYIEIQIGRASCRERV